MRIVLDCEKMYMRVKSINFLITRKANKIPITNIPNFSVNVSVNSIDFYRECVDAFIVVLFYYERTD